MTKARWDSLRKQVYNKAWDTCEICGGVGPKHPVECHEIWHYDDQKLIQKLIGMIALCPDCHMVKHIGLAGLCGNEDKAIRHFMKVNQVSQKETKKYITKAFEKWAERSTKEWTLDISVLQEYGIEIKNRGQ